MTTHKFVNLVFDLDTIKLVQKLKKQLPIKYNCKHERISTHFNRYWSTITEKQIVTWSLPNNNIMNLRKTVIF